MKLSVRTLVFLAVILGGLVYSGTIARAACQLDDVYHQVSLNKAGNAPSFATYATGESVTATVNTKQGFSCDGYQVQFMLCPVPGSSGADCSVGKVISTIPVANGSATATWTATQFNSFSNFKIKASAGTDNPNAGSSWQYYTDQFSILSGSQCGITNFTAPQSGSSINFNVTTNSQCEGKAVNIELFIQSSNLGTTSGGKVASGTIANSNFSGSWPLDTSLGVVYFKACITGVDTCQTSLTSGTPPGGSGGGGTCGGAGQPACPAGQTKTYFFSIPNPLKGGASDLTSLVQVIAQWIFNLAIPIAVAMIVYAGVIFLTAQGSEQKVTKAKDVLKWAVVGLAIILIGSGFITLIQSVLELGSDNATAPGNSLPIDGAQSMGAVGNKCSSDRNCLSVLKCKNSICQRQTGNLEGEPCNGGTSCSTGLACDTTGENKKVIDEQILGTCFKP